MGSRFMIIIIHHHLMIMFIQCLLIAALTNPQDAAALESLKDAWGHFLPSWVGSDPCENSWDGISCIGSRVISIKLSSIGLSGGLSHRIGDLTELKILDVSNNKKLTGALPDSIGNLKELTMLIVMGCSFTGPIPESIGSLENLAFLSLNSNNFTGRIPASIGNLSSLVILDIADNKLEGSIPVSDGISPGLDMLHKTQHFHFGRNRLSGEIPARLFNSNMTLIHLLLEDNQLEGSIPDSLRLVQKLQAVYLSNNYFTGPLPDLSGMSSLTYVDMSNNSFDPSDFPLWFSTLQSLETLVMERTNIQGEVPVSLFRLQELHTVILRNNQLNGTLNISNHNSKLKRIDLESNLIHSVTERDVEGIKIILHDNPICWETVNNQYSYCNTPIPANKPYSTPPCNVSSRCSSGLVPSPNCKCAYPYTGDLFFRLPPCSFFENMTSYASLEQSMMETFHSSHLPVDSVSLSTPLKNSDGYFGLHLQIFPSDHDRFNRQDITMIGFTLSTEAFLGQSVFFISVSYEYFDGMGSFSKKSSRNGSIVGATVGGSLLVILLLFAGVYAFRQKEKAEIASRRSNPFASWDPKKSSCRTPQVKRAEPFSFGALKKYTNNFSDTNDIGSGGYGKVYKGILPNGQIVAIKRAQQGSMQGFLEFKTEIELLSRVHHKNLVSLVGFCFDQGEQLLVYEYMSNGTLKHALLGKSGIRLNWMMRLQIALGAAKGLQYLHELADPPIIHRDIKSNNILLDEHLTAKVADFGLSKLAGELEKGHVTTQIKGTMGYLDPEYCMTEQLTEKSDVYSFGVLMLEIITARNPIHNKKYVVREVKETMDKMKELYNLQEILDPFLGPSFPPGSLEKFVDLALKCVATTVAHRPVMSEVVKEIENIMKVAGLNPSVDSESTSAAYEEAGKDPYSSESIFSYSKSFSSSQLESK